VQRDEQVRALAKLNAMTLPIIDGPTAEIAAIRRNEEVFAEWRSGLAISLGLIEDMEEGADYDVDDCHHRGQDAKWEAHQLHSTMLPGVTTITQPATRSLEAAGSVQSPRPGPISAAWE
jgi:hypothetical protein